jgi:hypothetical protein
MFVILDLLALFWFVKGTYDFFLYPYLLNKKTNT